MRGIRRLIHEIHRRSLWQVLGIYLGATWFVLQVADHLVDKFGLPPWVYGLAFLLMLLGLPIVLATAFVQEGIPGPEDRPDGAPGPGSGGSAQDETIQRLFTWRHAILGGLVACAAWGLVAAGWLVLLDRDPDALPWPRSHAASQPVVRGSVGASERALPRVTGAGDAGPVFSDDGAVPAREGELLRAEPETTGAAPERLRDGSRAGSSPEASRSEPPPRVTAAGGVRPGYETYLSARERAEAGRTEAAGVSADSLAGPAFARAESLRSLGLESAAAGRYPEAERDMVRALASFRDARGKAVASWTSALDSEAARVAEIRRGADSTREAYARARNTEGRSAELAADGHYREALALLAAAGDLYGSVPRPEAPPRAAARKESATVPAEVVRALLGRLSAALTAEDLATVERIWTSLDAEETANLERFFRDGRDIRVTYSVEDGSLTASDDAISFVARTTWEYFDEKLGRSVSQPPFTQSFVARRLDGGWVLTSR
ncbi:MAG TPA: hypothetical protein VKB18_06835 [Gemmatimonadota bacterium]|nr:hypothetical protein [Gemmatimonadota bacterium]